jgi:hypothetical protein
MTYPFGYVALDLTAEYHVRKDCIPDITEDIAECDIKAIPVSMPLTLDLTVLEGDLGSYLDIGNIAGQTPTTKEITTGLGIGPVQAGNGYSQLIQYSYGVPKTDVYAMVTSMNGVWVLFIGELTI